MHAPLSNNGDVVSAGRNDAKNRVNRRGVVIVLYDKEIVKKEKKRKRKRVDATDWGSFVLMADWIGAPLYGERERESYVRQQKGGRIGKRDFQTI